MGHGHAFESLRQTGALPLILGIDAAWTPTRSSGVALVDTDNERPRAVAVASSYSSFICQSHDSAQTRPSRRASGARQTGELLDAAERLARKPVNVIVVDMPLSHDPITGRRSADHAISSTFGGRGCSTHSPSAERPGPISDELRETAGHLGYPLTTALVQQSTKALIETYSHPAILRLTVAAYRVPYKVQRRRKYSPDLTPPERTAAVGRALSLVLDHLQTVLSGIELAIDTAAGPGELKKVEDIIDALVCCWVGAQWLDGAAEPFGNEQAAIWVPHQPAGVNA